MIGMIPAMKATTSGMRPRRAGLFCPSTIPITGITKKKTMSATREKSRFTASRPGEGSASRSSGLEDPGDPRVPQARGHDTGQPDQDAERLVDVLAADRAEEDRRAREIRARGGQRLAGQGGVARGH